MKILYQGFNKGARLTGTGKATDFEFTKFLKNLCFKKYFF